MLNNVNICTMDVKNVKGSSKISKDSKEGTSWRNFWEIRTRKTIGAKYTCPACGKTVELAHVDGCHVQKANSTDESWHVVPLCDECNHREGTFSIGNAQLTPVVYKD